MLPPASFSVDCDYRPLHYWAAKWGKDGEPIPLTTIRAWIRSGTCPAKKIGGIWMISLWDLLEWNAPAGSQDEPLDVEPARAAKGKRRRTRTHQEDDLSAAMRRPC